MTKNHTIPIAISLLHHEYVFQESKIEKCYCCIILQLKWRLFIWEQKFRNISPSVNYNELSVAFEKSRLSMDFTSQIYMLEKLYLRRRMRYFEFLKVKWKVHLA